MIDTFMIQDLHSAAWKLEENCRTIEDIEIRKMMLDASKMLCEICNDYENGCDGERSRPAIAEFKKKWFGNREGRLKVFVDERLAEVRKELIDMICENGGENE